ncbi:MAG: DUF2752 domain-containing protein [Bacteroidales bacterium]|jgi:hypothetical protein|nr:DUF2752 domain-containing protein [Bacteroidales bacterium]
MKKKYCYLYICGLLVLPILLFFISVDWLNEHQTICLFNNLFGIDCWGCGITRAVLSTLHFRFEDAFEYNKLVVVVFPLLVYCYIHKIIELFIYVKKH